MRILRHYDHVPEDLRGSSVAIGNFDGVHLGHRAVIGEAAAIAKAEGVPLSVLTFEPHPRRFFAPGQAPFRLTPLHAKAELMEGLGVDLLLVQRFDKTFSSKTAEVFVDDVIIGGLGARHVIAGYDFVFGKARGGSCETLLKLGERHGFHFTAVGACEDPDGLAYSSTRIRDHLAEGRPDAAARLLGRPFAIEGRVVRGDQRGRTIGFPTANVRLGRYLRPARGVYAVKVRIDAAPFEWRGVANLGKRPTFAGEDDLLEVFLFDFEGDIYGKRLSVGLIEFIRPEKKFDGIDALKAQIATDTARARALFS